MINKQAVYGSFICTTMTILLKYGRLSQFACFSSVLIILQQQKTNIFAIYSIIPMLSRLSPSPQPRAHLTACPSPPKPHFITLCTNRPSAQLSPREQNTLRPTLALSPNRHSPKIKLVSPLKKANGSDPTTKENSPTPHGILKMDQNASPGKKNYIELGGNTQRPFPRNFNQISNISIKHHLDGQIRSSPNKPISSKYSAFVIMGPKKNPEAARPQHHISINNKHFDISSLQSHIIHVAPFPHVRTQTAPSPPVIREETEQSSLKDSYQEELKNIQEMRKELEAESSRIKETLAASRIQQKVCTSQLVYANEEERSQKRSQSKLFNFEDVPLQQSRLTTQEKIYHPQEDCPEPRQRQNNVKIMYEQVTDTPQLHHQPVQICPQIIFVPPAGINTANTLINQLNFVTNSRLKNLREEVCVQTEQGPDTARSKLAIVRNQECLIKIGGSLKNFEPLPEVHQESIMEELYDQIAMKANEVEEKQQSVIEQKSAIQDGPQSSQLLAMLKEEHNEETISNKDASAKQEQVKQQQIIEIPKELHRSNSSICSQTILVPQRQGPVISQKQVIAESNISLQLQPAPLQQQTPKISQSAISDKLEIIEFPKMASQKLPRSNLNEKPAILSLQSARSTLGKQAWPKRGVTSKRSIHNSIYL